MVVSEVWEKKKEECRLNMDTKRSTPLHNFTLPTSLKWGTQRFLRCANVNSNGEIMSSSDRDRRSSGSEGDSDVKDLNLMKQRSLKSLPQSSGLKLKIERDEDVDIEEFREKLLIHFQTATEKMKFSIPDENHEDESGVASALRPWNLRTRRAACKAPNGSGSSKLDERQHQQKLSPQKTEHPSPKSLRLKGLAATVANQPNQGVEKKERPRFSISITRDELKEDFLLMTGNNPSRRPKKRPRIIQKKLDSLLPGLWLNEVTTDTYKVPDELVDTKKK